MQLYDGIIVQISTCLRRDRGEQVSIRALCLAFLAFAATMPTVIAELVGVDLGDGPGIDEVGGGSLDALDIAATDMQEGMDNLADMGDAFEGMVDIDVGDLQIGTGGLGAMQEGIDDLAERATAFGEVNLGNFDFLQASEFLSGLATTYYWAARPLPVYHKAATKMQKVTRGHFARAQFAAQLERHRKQKTDVILDVVVRERSDDASPTSRPGFVWVETRYRVNLRTTRSCMSGTRNARRSYKGRA